MASSDFESPWQGVLALDRLSSRSTLRPRRQGVTMVIDTGIGPCALRDILALSGDHIDHWKFGFGTSALMPVAVLEEKLALLHERDIVTYPGGTLLEAAIVQQQCGAYAARAKKLGFRAIEISEGTIDVPGERRRRVIQGARNAGLIAITEVGRKSPERQPSAGELAAQALQDLAWGASWVIVEARESGRGIGIYDKAGAIRPSFFDEMIRLVGADAAHLIWEAPQRPQQAELIQRLGPDVSLGNIDSHQCLALEALRRGLRFETLSPVAEHWRKTGIWDPTRFEAQALVAPAVEP